MNFTLLYYIFFYRYGDHRDLPSFPTRRSSDLLTELATTVIREITDLDARTSAYTKLATAGVKIRDRKSTRLNSSHPSISYAVFCLKKKKTKNKKESLWRDKHTTPIHQEQSLRT